MATLTVTATGYPANSPPGVRLDITASGTPTVTSVTVTRTDAASGKTYPVRTPDGGPLPVSGGGATIWDYEIPYGSTSTYSVAATGVTTVTASASLAVPDVWLVHVGLPALSTKVRTGSLGDLSRATDRGLFQIIGRSDPVPVTGGARTSASGSLKLVTISDAERSTLGLLLDDGTALFLNVPASKGWGLDSCYISVGDVTEARPVRVAADPYREWTLPFQVVGRPAGGSQSLVTWQTVYDSNGSPTWTALYAAQGNPTWAQLANPIS